VPKPVHSQEFFVVGGPVQPDRPCYVERDADRELLDGIATQRFCYVLGPRATGKSSLMARTIRALRREGQLAAVVDLTQIGARNEAVDAGRWYYSIAYRIVRELRLKVDLQAWWQEKSALGSEQRLAEFFGEIVLANTTEPVTIFIDEIERTLDLLFAQDLFTAIHACYARRVTEPDYARLNFVVLGTATPARLCPDSAVSPFGAGQAIELKDFTPAQTYRLAAGFDGDPREAREVLDRIHSWTGGHPYLTQKVARVLARRRGRPEHVERVVRELFLVPGIAQEEPLLVHMREALTEQRPGMRQRLALLDKIAKGLEVYADPGSPGVASLVLSGVVAVDHRRLRYRNRICAQIFNSRFTSAARPFDWRATAAVAALAAIVVFVPFWYTQMLPRPYIRTLSLVTDDIAVAEQAYERLHRLPGFARTADRLLAEAVTRRSERSTTLAAALEADEVLRRLPDGDALADGLLADFWLRQAERARHAERRDEALLYAAQALDARPERVRAVAAELVGHDYQALERTFRLSAAPLAFEPDWGDARLTVVDAANRAQRLALGDVRGEPEAAVPTVRLTALQHLPVLRELSVDGTGAARGFVLTLDLEHPAASQLAVTLTAPSGAAVALPLDRAGATDDGFRFSAAAEPLAVLANEERQGVWRLAVIDRVPGAIGRLSGWSLEFAGGDGPWRDDPEQGIAIPDPTRTEQVAVEVGAGGRLALARPARPGAVGALTLWDLAAGRIKADLEMPIEPDVVAFNAQGTRLLIVADGALAVVDTDTGAPVAEFVTRTEFVLPPMLDPDGDYVAIAERDAVGRSQVSLLRSSDGELVASLAAGADLDFGVLGPQARYLALLEAERHVRVVDPRRGVDVAELPHDREIVRLAPVPVGDQLLTVDSAGDVRTWPLAVQRAGAERPLPTLLGTTVDPMSLSVATDAAVVAYEAANGHVVVHDLGAAHGFYDLRVERRGPGIVTRLSPAGDRLVTANGRVLRLWALERALPVPPGDMQLTAAAVDPSARVAALGFRGGNVRVRSSAELERGIEPAKSVDYIGHRGAVTALALNAARGTIASGGVDGVVRAWELASVAPTAHFMRHPAGPIHAVAVSPNGRLLGSAAEYSARVWDAATGELVGEVLVNGAALALAFAPDTSLLAVGDSAGNVFFAEPTGSVPLRSARAQSAVTSIAFSPDGRLVATGDDSGSLQLWDPQSGAPFGEAHALPLPIRWVAFAADGGRLFALTDHWVHALAIDARTPYVVSSLLLPVGLDRGTALAALSGERLRIVGAPGIAAAGFVELDLAVPSLAPLPPESPLLERDWGAALGLQVAANGVAAPLP